MTMNFKRIEALAAAAAVLALAGCSSVELDESLKKGTTQEDAAAQSGAGLAGVNEHSVYFAFDSYFQMLFRTGQITGLVAADTIPMIIGGIAWRLFDQLFKGRFGFRVLTFIV